VAAVRRVLVVAVGAAVALLTIPAAGAASSAASALPAPRFEPTACPSEPFPTSLPADARCGFLIVPENRASANGRTIRLTVGIVPAASPTPAPDPVVYLAGGPGGYPLGEAKPLIDAGFNRDRDLILMSQRGTLYAPPNPAPTCPEIDRASQRGLGLPLDGSLYRRLTVAATRACNRRLVATGIDLGAYNTTENAADFADLRVALGIAEWNVFGVSYGTNLAMTLMRQHPQGIRSVTIDSVEPPEVVTAGSFAPNAREGFDRLFRACAAQPQCWPRRPGIAQTFTKLVRRLEAHPVAARVKPPTGGSPVRVVLDGGALVNWLIDEAFNTPHYRDIPTWIAELADGDPRNIARARAAPILATPPGALGYGLALGVGCAEWVPYEQGSVLSIGRRAFPAYPASVLAPALHVSYLPDSCRVWPVPNAPAEQRAATPSAIPTLLLSGSFDGITPTSWARIAARTLPNSTVADFAGIGHFVTLASPCAQEVFASFLATPSAPRTACVAAVRPPTFVPAPAASPGPCAARTTTGGPGTPRARTRFCVINSRYDPNSAYANAVRAERQLGNAVLLTHEGYGHLSSQNPSALSTRRRSPTWSTWSPHRRAQSASRTSSPSIRASASSHEGWPAPRPAPPHASERK
jgi:pimeloyl-ACP methyl ester carboxylesterase